MLAPVTTDLVWSVVEKHVFAVLAHVTPAGEARSAGIVYVVDDHTFYISTGRATWKARHIRANPSFAHHHDPEEASLLSVPQDSFGRSNVPGHCGDSWRRECGPVDRAADLPRHGGNGPDSCGYLCDQGHPYRRLRYLRNRRADDPNAQS